MSKVAMTVAEAVEYSSIGKTVLFGLLKDHKIPRRKLGRKTLILRTDLDAYINSLPVAA